MAAMPPAGLIGLTGVVVPHNSRNNGGLPFDAKNATGNHSKNQDSNGTPTDHGRDVDNML
jgi:hypothetical protein